jgi:NAD(P)-dependent dehydrogenase (short-subunit alcohol dehydrogenase family)
MARQPRSLSGKVAVITGGGRGIGEAIARALTAEGARVAVGDLDAPAAERVAESLGHDALGLPLDVTDLPGFTEFLDEVERRLGPIDVLVNNAGIMPVTPFADERPESIVRQLEINLHGVIHGTHEAVTRMTPRGSGHIVNIASMAGRVGFPNLATYCATKHGVIGLSEALRAELRGTGLELSVVMPGVVDTELGTGLGTTKGVKVISPQEVAAEIVAALKAPRFDVYVPRSAGVTYGMVSLLPRRAREAFSRALGAHEVAKIDPAERAAYEARAAASAPAAEAEQEKAAAAETV